MVGVEQELAYDYADAVFVGIGGCGINVVSRLRNAGVKGSRTVCINRFSDELPVKGEDVVNFALLGKKKAPGRHREPVSAGERANAEKLVREAVKGAKKVLLFAGLGGFTGTAVTQVAAAAVKAEGAALGMIITYPFKMEKKRCELAEQACPALRNMADDFVLRRNDDLLHASPDKPLSEAFQLCDLELAEKIKKGARRVSGNLGKKEKD